MHEPRTAILLLIAACLLGLAVLVLAPRRRRRDAILLSSFLAAVGVNFLATAFIVLQYEDPPLAWVAAGHVALAFDPVLLLAFVSVYPYKQAGRRRTILLAALTAVAVVVAALAVAEPESIVRWWRATAGFSVPFVQVGAVVVLVTGYAAAWLGVIASAREAPSALLGEQGRWLVLAVGVAVVPRMAQVPYDLQLHDLGWVQAIPDTAFYGVTGLLPIAILFGAGRYSASHDPRLLRMVRTVGWITLVLLALDGIMSAATGTLSSATLLWGLRWVVFGAILVQGLLAHRIVDFEARRARTVPLLGGLVGATAFYLFFWALISSLGQPDHLALAAGAAFGLASLVPAAWLTDRALRRALPRPAGGDRRLEVYRAAVEQSWGQGNPSARGRRRLEVERRSLGLSRQEALVVEALVAGEMALRHWQPRRGEEIAPGIVIGDQLGEGGDAVVYAASQVSSGQALVVKVYRHGPEARRRFQAELRALEGLRHPNVTQLHSATPMRGGLVLVLEKAPGGSLADRLRAGPLPEEMVQRMALDVLAALEAAHALGIVHGDVKPSNILFAEDGTARITDFGASASAMDWTATRAIGPAVGTPPYMAPEALRGRRLGPTADLYALGVVLRQCLTGSLTGSGKRPSVPPAWHAILRRSLAVRPQDRFEDAASMARAMRAVPTPGTPAAFAQR